jgi:redox-sensitive bicupin YhaK (pirin superfamily)
MYISDASTLVGMNCLNHQGAVTHEDFEGHKGTIGAGDVQWMTAGRGILHSEMPAAQGTQKGLQLWINLSSKHKMYVYTINKYLHA